MLMHIYTSWVIHTPNLVKVTETPWAQLHPQKFADGQKDRRTDTLAGRTIPALFFADDMVLMAVSVEGMQRMLREVGEWGRRNGLEFNAAKSAVMRWGGERQEWTMCGGVELQETVAYKYLGVWMGTGKSVYKPTMERKAEKAKKLGGLCKAVAIGSHNRPKMAKVMWDRVAKPAILYGSEVVKYTREAVEGLDMKQRDVGRVALGVLKGTANSGVLGEMGWMGIKEEMVCKKLIFYGHLKYLPQEWWSKQVWMEGEGVGGLV